MKNNFNSKDGERNRRGQDSNDKNQSSKASIGVHAMRFSMSIWSELTIWPDEVLIKVSASSLNIHFIKQSSNT